MGLGQNMTDYSAQLNNLDETLAPLYVDILTAGEVINISLCGREDTHDVSMEIYAPSDYTTPVFTQSLTEGNVACDDPMTAPLTNAVKYTTTEIGAYRLVLENDDANELNRVDVSVTPDTNTDPDPTIAAGRLWAFEFSFRVRGVELEDSTDADYFALLPGGSPDTNYIWKLDLNNFAGNGYDIIANSIGVDAPNSGFSTPQTGNNVTHEFPLYLGVPAIANPRPTNAPQVTNHSFLDDAGSDNGISPSATNGVEDTGVFRFTSDVIGNYRINIDLNQDGIFGNIGDHSISGRTVIGANEVVWDGEDASGAVPALGTYNAEISVATGEFHFIAEDVETSGGDEPGLTIFAADNAGTISDTLVYWDDITILGDSTGTATAPLGALSSSLEARHTWGNFTADGFGNDRLIDTYVFGLESTVPTTVRITDNDTPPSTAPVATDDSATVAADTVATIDLTDNVSDAENDVDVTTIDLDPNLSGNQNTLTTGDGVWSANAQGVVSFDPDADFEGTATTPYTVEDDDGNESNSATVSVTVAGAAPVSTADSVSVAADTVATIDLSDNVSDANNDVDLSTVNLDPSASSIQNTLTTAEGVWSVDTLGVVSFDPAPGFTGTASITYTVQDDDGNESNSSTVSVAVAGATPVTTADSANVASDTEATIDLTDNVADANDDLDLSTIDLDQSTTGNQNTLTTADGVWSANALGVVSFVPEADFEGTAVILYTVEDDDGNESNSSTISVIVAGATPVATADSVSVAADTVATIDLSDNVSDANNDVDLSTIDLDQGTPGNQNTLTTADGVWNVDALGVVSFDPVSGFEGEAIIPFTVEDDDGNESAPANVSVTIAGVAPVTTSDSAVVAAGNSATIDLSDNITDANNNIDLSTIDLVPSTSGNQSSLTTADGVWSVNALGEVSFVPNSDFEGTATVPYTVEDDNGNESNSSTVAVTVAGATPVASSTTVVVSADNSAFIDMTALIADANDDILLNTIDLDPGSPGVQSTLSTADGDWSVDGSGELTFNPLPSFEGVATVSYVVSDDDGNLSNVAEVSVSVGGAAPVADAELATTAQGINVLIDVLDGDVDMNGDLDPTTIDLDPATPGNQNSFNVLGEGVYTVVSTQVEFVPVVTFIGDSSFIYTVSDNAGNVSNEASVTVTVEAALDHDSDGIPDHTDLDDDNDGIPDMVEGVGDTDNDGIIDSLDLDSDNDGIPDALEAGGADADGNGVIDGFTDINLDGMDDATLATPLPIDDFDGDSRPDYLDVDSDNDGLTDAIEAGGSDGNGDGIIDGLIDANGDGLNDVTAVTPLPIPDTDGDGSADYLELDSDKDGIPDITEAGGADADGDGIVDSFADNDGDGLADSQLSTPLPVTDTDGNGTPDYQQLDSDADGIPDSVEAGNSPARPVDTDGDSVPDFQEEDSDKDGIPDAVEAGDNPTTPVDTDGDNVPDYREEDSDNDTIPDAVEAGSDPEIPADTDVDGTPDYREEDSDNDTIPDAVEAGSDPENPADTDADGTPDFQEEDSDNDAIPDQVEAGSDPESPVDTDGDGTPDFREEDSDNDSIPDSEEAGSDPSNPEDSDGNGVPDFLEVPDVEVSAALDSDGDGIPDDVEGSDDADGDGIANFLDIDSDNDGLLDTDEAVDGDRPVDTDNDGVVDYLDLDSDNDGLTDTLEAGGSDIDGDGVVDNFVDSNGDGHDDGVGVAPLSADDYDGDGIADWLDVDSDNDGLSDVLESLGANADTDGDGRVDNIIDADANGLADGINVNSTVDTDTDSAFNHLDRDSDDDGIADVIEAGGEDADNDGQVDAWSDVDADGIPDTVDADLFTGEDADNDGIADFADADFVNESDADGDGIIDQFDDDAFGNGFIPLGSEPITEATLPDSNGNNVADVLEPALGGAIRTGLSGSAAGCSIGEPGQKQDVMMFLLLMLASFKVIFGRFLRHRSR